MLAYNMIADMLRIESVEFRRLFLRASYACKGDCGAGLGAVKTSPSPPVPGMGQVPRAKMVLP